MWSSSTLANPNERYLPYKICFDPISKSEATFLRDSKHTTRQSCPSLSCQPCLVAYYPAPGGEMDSRDVVIVTSRGIWLCQQDDESIDDRVVATNEEPNDWLSSATNSNDIFVATRQGVKAFHLVSGKCTNTHLPFKQQDELKKTRNWAKCEETILAEDLNDDLDRIATNSNATRLALNFATCPEIWILVIDFKNGKIHNVQHKFTLDRSQSSTISISAMEFMSLSNLIVLNPNKSLMVWNVDEGTAEGKKLAIPFKSHYLNTCFCFSDQVLAVGNTNGDVTLMELRDGALLAIGSTNVTKALNQSLKDNNEGKSSRLSPKLVSTSKRRQTILDEVKRLEESSIEDQDLNAVEVSSEIIALSFLDMGSLVTVTKLGMVLINAKSREAVSVLVFETIFQGGLLNSLVSNLKLFPMSSISDDQCSIIPIQCLIQLYSGTFWKLDLNTVFHILSSPPGVTDSVNGLECTDIETSRLQKVCHCSDEHLPFESGDLSVVAIDPVELESFLHGDNHKSKHETDKKTNGFTRPKRHGSSSSSSSSSLTTKTNRTNSRSTDAGRWALLGPEKDAVSRIRFNWNSE